MFKTFSLFVLLLLTGIGVAACGNNTQSQESKFPSADEVWTKLTSSGPRPERIDGEPWLNYFMRQVEASDRRRRELGLQFWDHYPNDPRRYQWLLSTVHMPPRYALDIHEWAANENTLLPNAAAVDDHAIVQWEARYVLMRKEFWSALEVTDEERRYLWFGEVKQSILRAREAHARGETVDRSRILDEVIAFAETYPEPTGELDGDRFYTMFSVLTELVFREDLTEGEDPLLIWTPEDARAFRVRMIQTGNVALKRLNPPLLDDYILEQGRLPANRPLIRKDDASERAWRTLQFPGPNPDPSSHVGYTVRAHERLVNATKRRELGVDLWRQTPHHQMQGGWLRGIQEQISAYPFPLHIVDYLQSVARNRGRAHSAQYAEDQGAMDEWESKYEIVRADYWNHQNTTESDRGALEASELFGELAKWGGREGSPQRVGHDGAEWIELALRTREHILRYPSTHRHSTLVNMIIYRYLRYLDGTDEELQEFLEPLLNDDDNAVRYRVQGKLNQISQKNIPFEFRARNLTGEEFDIASLRGKIVLIDHWTTKCSSCIAAMPRIHEVYMRYRDKGFEVVSICYDATTERKRVLRTEHELGLTWTTLDGESQRSEVFEKYGYLGVPQYMLLNRDGTLYAGTPEVDMGRNLEALLDEMLAAEAAENKSTAID